MALPGAPSAWSRPDNAGEVRFAWQPYQSLEPELVLRHAHVILTPPAGVALSMDGNTLRLQGVASYSRNKRARWAARLIPGVGLVDDSELLETR